MNSAKDYLKNEFSPAIANAKKNGWIEIHENRMMLKGYHDAASEEKIIKMISSKHPVGVSVDEFEDKNALESLKKRPEFIVLASKKSIIVNLTEKGIETAKNVPDEISLTNISETMPASDSVEVRAIDVEAPAPPIFAARSHPLRD